MLIYFEGLSGVGKTTLINSIHDNRIIKVPEYITKPENIYNDETCMRNDEEKIDLAIRDTDKVVLVDRGYISTLVYGMVRYELTKGKERVDHLLEWVIKKIGKELQRPDLYIWIDAPNDISLKRARKVNNIPPNDYWYIDLNLCRYWYTRLFEIFESNTPIMKLDGTKSIETNLSIIKKTIDENTID